MKILHALSRSIFAQMALLTFVLLGWGFYTFVIMPVADRPEIVEADPLVITQGRATQILSSYAFGRRYGEEASDPRENPEFRAILAANPNMRYYVETKNGRAGNTSHPKLYDEYHIADITRQIEQAPPGRRVCAQVGEPLKLSDGLAFVQYTLCPEYSYFEFTGLTEPIVLPDVEKQSYWDKWVTFYSDYFLYPVAIVFALFAAILGLNFSLIRRVARITQAIGPDGTHRRIPEKGLPIEVLPLVRAVNRVIWRMEEDERQRHLFLSAAAHELRTPLTVLRTRLEMIEDDEMRTRLVGDVRRLSSMVKQLLLLMGVREQRLQDEVDLRDVVEDAREQHLPAAMARNVTITVEAPDAPVIALGKAELLMVAVGNLIENAVRFAPDDSAVDVVLGSDGTITVRDRGEGIPEDRLSDIFEPFVRLKHRPNGHGLGLAIVKAIADLHRGHVQAENAEGGGARFVLGLGTVGSASSDLA
ncbi:sensor histidine kinase [Aurantiacibacter xanthus]|nr:HAMP domain-containing sensor histidine kinase [Aurantiacibacter xanthus]